MGQGNGNVLGEDRYYGYTPDFGTRPIGPRIAPSDNPNQIAHLARTARFRRTTPTVQALQPFQEGLWCSSGGGCSGAGGPDQGRAHVVISQYKTIAPAIVAARTSTSLNSPIRRNAPRILSGGA